MRRFSTGTGNKACAVATANEAAKDATSGDGTSPEDEAGVHLPFVSGIEQA
jgi:hypothetical protein